MCRFALALGPLLAALAGCAAEPGVDPPTWGREVAPLVEARCLGCHARGRIAGSLPLQTWAQAAPLADAMAHQVATGQMPPWAQAATEDCPAPYPFVDDPRPSAAERALLADWARAGAPRGPRIPPLEPAPDPPLEGANQVLELPAQRILAGERDLRTCFAMDLGLEEEAWLEGAAIEPLTPEVLHHAGIRIVGPASGLVDGDRYPCNGGAGVAADYVGTYAPGSGPSLAPAGSAMRVGPGSLVVVNVHHHPLPDRTVVGGLRLHLRWAEGPPERVAELRHWPDPPELELADLIQPSAFDLDEPALIIPASLRGHTERLVSEPVGRPGTWHEVWQVAAHMHRVGVRARVWAEHPDGQSTCLLHLDRWDFDWQRMYRFADGQGPVIPGGSRLWVECVYDNTLDNPGVLENLEELGLSEPVQVHYGPETTDEMCMFMVGTLPR